MQRHKYVRKADGFIIFPETFSHDEIGNKSDTISAGFCIIDTELEECFCNGESISIGVKSHPEDSKEMTVQLFGYTF